MLSHVRTSVTDQLGHTTHFGYDVIDKLACVTDPLSNMWAYTYGPNYDGASARVIAEETFGAPTTTYTYDTSGALFSMTRAGETYYYHTNARGDVVAMTDSTGDVVNTHAYDPWGTLLSASETVANPYRYASYRYDSATGLSYCWNRYYAPELARFLTRDIYPGELSDPVTMNPYLYCGGDPVNALDPSGMALSLLGVAAVVVVALGAIEASASLNAYAPGRDVRVVILGSSPLLMQAGMSESLAGRFEVLRWTHWTYAECRAAFGWNLERFLFFGGYPGAAPLTDDVPRWRSYIVDSLIETSVSRDILLMTRVDKPALLRQLFALGCEYSGQILSYTKMLGQLTDAGNTTTLAHYLDLLGGAGLVTGLPKYAGGAVRQRASSPKLQVLNTALMTAVSGREPGEAVSDEAWRGRLVESAVGAYLLARAHDAGFAVRYWREGDREVDFVLESRNELVAIEVKSDDTPLGTHRGMLAFGERYPDARLLTVGADGVPLERFLLGEAGL